MLFDFDFALTQERHLKLKTDTLSSSKGTRALIQYKDDVVLPV